MRRLIVTAAAIVLLGVWIAWTVFYPVKVTLVFDYRGKHFETSYLTTAKMHFNDPVSFFRLDLGRHVTRVELPDASFIELRTDWPIFHFGAGFKNGMPLMVSWLWLDNGKSPKQIVIGDTLTRPPIGSSSQLPWMHSGAIIDRVGYGFLPEAIRSNKSPDRTLPVEYSNFFYHRQFEL